MRRYSPNRDRNEPELLKLAAQLGATWAPCRDRDVFDGTLGYRGVNYAVEIKQPGKKLKTGQAEFHEKWAGDPIRVIRTAEDLLKMLGVGRTIY